MILLKFFSRFVQLWWQADYLTTETQEIDLLFLYKRYIYEPFLITYNETK